MNMNDIESKYTLICERTGNNIKEDISKELAEFLMEKGIAVIKSGTLVGTTQLMNIWIEKNDVSKWVLIETEDNDILEPDTYDSYTEAYIEMEKRHKEIYDKCFCVGGHHDDETNIHEDYAFVDYDAVRISWRIYEVK